MTCMNKVAVVLANSPEFEGSKNLEVLESINTVLNSLPEFEEIFIVTSKHISNLYTTNEFKFTREAKLVAVPRT